MWNLVPFDERTYDLHMFLMPDSLCKNKVSIISRNFDSCDFICGTEVLYSIIWDSDLIFKMTHCRSRAKGYKFFMLNSAEHEIQITHIK